MAIRTLLLTPIVLLALADLSPLSARRLHAAPPAFPGAVGQGAAATGGRGGDVYHVTNLEDYDPKNEPKILGSLRHAIRSAEKPRTIVFDVSGAIALHAPLRVLKDNLTIGGQTSPGGITLWGYPVEVSDGATNIIIRYLRIRTGDFHARSKAAADDNAFDPGSANGLNVGGGCERVILDHISVSWGIDETLSVTKCRDVTVQNSIIAESLNKSFHPKGEHGYGSLIRGELTAADQEAGHGGFTLYGNLWAHHKARNPSVGGQQTLDRGQSEADRRRTDVNFVNNVVYDWGDQATHRSEHGDVRINLIGNYYISGPAKAAKYFFREGTPGRSTVYQRGNWQDLDRDGEHDGAVVDGDQAVARAFQGFGAGDSLVSEGDPFNFFGDLAESATSAEQAYRLVVESAGASLWRDAVDRRVIKSLTARTGGLVDSQEQFRTKDGKMPGIDDLPANRRADDFDVDGDGMADEFERAHGLNPTDADDGNASTLSADGYANLEVYLHSLTEREPGAR